MKDKVSSDDRELFREQVGEVRPVTRKRVVHRGTKPSPIPIQTRLEEERTLHEMRTTDYARIEQETGEELSYARPGLHHTILRKLRRGRFSVTRELDLHGMTVEMAREALKQFLLECREEGDRCVRIIHGKGRGSIDGQPVLKRKLNRWLRQWDGVEAFCSARPVDGGTGAVYLLLRGK